MTPDEKRAQIERVFEALNENQMEVIDEIFAEDYVEHDPMQRASAWYRGYTGPISWRSWAHTTGQTWSRRRSGWALSSRLIVSGRRLMTGV